MPSFSSVCVCVRVFVAVYISFLVRKYQAYLRRGFMNATCLLMSLRQEGCSTLCANIGKSSQLCIQRKHLFDGSLPCCATTPGFVDMFRHLISVSNFGCLMTHTHTLTHSCVNSKLPINATKCAVSFVKRRAAGGNTL